MTALGRDEILWALLVCLELGLCHGAFFCEFDAFSILRYCRIHPSEFPLVRQSYYQPPLR